MEIDLTELEMYEKRLAEKRRTTMNSSMAKSDNLEQNIDEIDEYLDRLAIDLKAKDDTKSDKQQNESTSNAFTTTATNHSVSKQCQSSLTTDNHVDNNFTQLSSNTSFPLLLFGFLSILVFVNSIRCKNALNTNPKQNSTLI